jgi:hypothetical protein
MSELGHFHIGLLKLDIERAPRMRSSDILANAVPPLAQLAVDQPVPVAAGLAQTGVSPGSVCVVTKTGHRVRRVTP